MGVPKPPPKTPSGPREPGWSAGQHVADSPQQVIGAALACLDGFEISRPGFFCLQRSTL